MTLRSDPRRFSITAFMADQVDLVARHEHLSPGEAAIRLRTLSANANGRRQLLAIVRDACRTETDPLERSKLAALRAEVVAWNRAAEVAR
jgi:hypothetical protein